MQSLRPSPSPAHVVSPVPELPERPGPPPPSPLKGDPGAPRRPHPPDSDPDNRDPEGESAPPDPDIESWDQEPPNPGTDPPSPGTDPPSWHRPPPGKDTDPPGADRDPPGRRMEETGGNAVIIRIGIPDLQQTKCLRLNPDAPVWVAKQRILCTLNHSLKDVLNYGLFQPAFNGRAGKFLDEERLLREYPPSVATPVPYLEFRYKRRVYTQALLDDKQFAKLHTKGNLKKFMDYIQMQNIEKVTRLLERGLDPNYQDPDTGGKRSWGPHRYNMNMSSRCH
ncbi:SH3 and multiple ankyrin repeat domains protein 3 [Bombina bombina]|uniref:SH3 and multiple ankyrin repeat domains protein 3 n=1 Tax=Bombina bombina TaxID=8345 RepID=UPI00235A9A1B|nr:SH3 and multiple ankyrin repeat domains protein 3 [Bombina bombina]